ncbi:ABC transporter permease subunit [Paenibacillus psychroresistens]|uniref:ABC transporter permease subunit n=1 Tax=Paenibacillus psychroresistens TaxID=1778678 RepID=A0A6B8RWZ1_9BACL|nr:PQQ-binding-like beta-propeller repeat protein [Paenibacillus psychroresistens]QGQ99686.1 ABC transporter permease subunit [Paenibacillus psychroresistens]
MNAISAPKKKGINLRGWTIASIVLLSISFILFAVVWFLDRSLETPVAWTKDFGIQESVAALDNDAGLVIGGKDNQISRVDNAGNIVWTFKTTGSVKGLALSKDEQEIAAATEDRLVYILDIKTGTMKKSWKIPYPATTIEMSPQGLISVSAGAILASKYRIYTFDHEGTEIWKYESNVAMRSLVYSADGQTLFIGTDSSRIMALDKSGKSVWEFVSKAPIYGVNLISERIIYADKLGTVGALDSKGKSLWTTSYKEVFTGLTSSSTGDSLMLANEQGNLKLISAKNGGEITQLPLNNGTKYVHMDQSGKNLIAAGEQVTFVNVVAMESFNSISQQRGIFFLVLVCVGIVAICVLILRLLFQSYRIQQSLLLTLKLVFKNKTAYLLLLPTLLLLALFNYYPAYSAFYHSFTDWKPGLSTTFVGFEQYIKVFNSHYFWIGINNMLFLVVSRALQLIIPLLVAVMIFHLASEKAKYFMRNLFIYPLVVPSIVGTLLWFFIYDPNFGMLNQALGAVGLESLQHVWLGETKTAMPALAFMGFPWIGAFSLLIFYGGMIGIPKDVFEAGIMDGIGKYRRFWSIELPLLTGQIRLLLVLTFIGTIQDFTLVYLTTLGGPFDSTYLPALELFFAATRFNDYGYASAMGIILFIFILIGTIFQLKVKTADQ